jgi:hypothetical protein
LAAFFAGALVFAALALDPAVAAATDLPAPIRAAGTLAFLDWTTFPAVFAEPAFLAEAGLAAAARPTAAVFLAGTRPAPLLPLAAPAGVTDLAVLRPATALAPLDPATIPGVPTVTRFAVPEIGCGSVPEAAGLVGAFLAAGIGVFPPCE